MYIGAHKICIIFDNAFSDMSLFLLLLLLFGCSCSQHVGRRLEICFQPARSSRSYRRRHVSINFEPNRKQQTVNSKRQKVMPSICRGPPLHTLEAFTLGLKGRADWSSRPANCQRRRVRLLQANYKSILQLYPKPRLAPTPHLQGAPGIVIMSWRQRFTERRKVLKMKRELHRSMGDERLRGRHLKCPNGTWIFRSVFEITTGTGYCLLVSWLLNR